MDYIICEDILKLKGKIKKIVFSSKRDKSSEISKVTLRPFTSKKGEMWQAEKIKGAQAFHENLTAEELLKRIDSELRHSFSQCCLTAEGTTLHYTIFPDKTKRKLTGNEIKAVKPESHNKEKNYILRQGDNIPALVDLGVFTEDFKVVKSKYDKYKQINRFIEIVDDAFSSFGKDEVTILDFGCGKSYLTFIIYHYFTVIKKVKATVIGYDLKEEVVNNCNKIAEKYGYENLKFYINDVTKGELYKGDVDMVITLHACDIATDFALYHAIENKVKYIFSVPCCQHEICSSIGKGGDLDLLLDHGLIKERFCALLTDSIRAEILKKCGYEVDVIEFVDFTHSPKNLMLRCRLKKSQLPDLSEIKALTEKYSFTQKLFSLIEDKS
ncbi:MAG: SAM-dependent methyltransferase [Ruminococcaceae bacterium]|nr:SAM-dependent methyltransferase [Oscillospiraceae bacterium]